MKKKLFSFALCMALLFSFTVCASADFSSADSTNLNNIEREITDNRYAGSYTLRGFLYALFYGLGYTTEGSTDTLKSNIATLIDRVSGVATRIVELQDLTTTTNATISTSNGFLNSLVEGLSQFYGRNHDDISSFQSLLNKRFSNGLYYNDPSLADPYIVAYYTPSTGSYSSSNIAWGDFIGQVYLSLTTDGVLYTDKFPYRRSLYGLISQMQQVLASDDDLALKKDNKANEDAATDAFLNGSSSKTSLGASDFGNLKDIGGSFNDLSSLNGQASVGSFTSGLSSADEVGQGWFSEATRASLDAVTPSNSRAARSLSRSFNSSAYSVSSDVAPVRLAPAPDTYNMSGFEENYAWLWGDAS